MITVGTVGAVSQVALANDRPRLRIQRRDQRRRYRLGAMKDPRLLQMSALLVDYPFADRLYPGALDVVAHPRTWGPTVILSDGNVVFQPRKVQRSGLWEAVEGRVLIYTARASKSGEALFFGRPDSC